MQTLVQPSASVKVSGVRLPQLASGLSMMWTVPVPWPSLMARPTGLLSTQLKTSSLSRSLLHEVWRVIVAVTSPGAKVTVPVAAV